MKKILIIPARRHVAEAYCEYLVRYLGDEFDIQIGYPSVGNDSPLAKNPDDFDLIYPQFDSHWFLDPPEKYAHKVVNVQFEPGGTRFKTVGACTSEPVHKSFPHDFHLRYGVDTELFKPFPQPKDDRLHVGFMGNIQTPRRYMKELFIPLHTLEGVKIDIYPTTWLPHTRPDEIELMGGQTVVDNLVDGDKWWSGLPNLYNRMDVYVRCDINAGYQYSLVEAAACGVPIVTTDPGMGKEICDQGGGLYVECDDGNWAPDVLEKLSNDIREAVEILRDTPLVRKTMGKEGRKFVEENYTWDKWAPKWRKFFQKGIEHANREM